MNHHHSLSVQSNEIWLLDSAKHKKWFEIITQINYRSHHFPIKEDSEHIKYGALFILCDFRDANI